jgi:hypothetical protein
MSEYRKVGEAGYTCNTTSTIILGGQLVELAVNEAGINEDGLQCYEAGTNLILKSEGLILPNGTTVTDSKTVNIMGWEFNSQTLEAGVGFGGAAQDINQITVAEGDNLHFSFVYVNSNSKRRFRLRFSFVGAGFAFDAATALDGLAPTFQPYVSALVTTPFTDKTLVKCDMVITVPTGGGGNLQAQLQNLGATGSEAGDNVTGAYQLTAGVTAQPYTPTYGTPLTRAKTVTSIPIDTVDWDNDFTIKGGFTAKVASYASVIGSGSPSVSGKGFFLCMVTVDKVLRFKLGSSYAALSGVADGNSRFVLRKTASKIQLDTETGHAEAVYNGDVEAGTDIKLGSDGTGNNQINGSIKGFEFLKGAITDAEVAAYVNS